MDLESAVFSSTKDRLLARFGTQVEDWWARLPGVVAELSERWRLRLGTPVGSGNTSLVLRCLHDDGRAAMLKLTPDTQIATAEAHALRGWERSGHVPAVWGHDKARGALLLEAIASETPLAASGDGVALHEVADLIRSLHETGSPVVGNGVGPLADRVRFIFEYWMERLARDEVAVRAVPAARLRRGYELALSLAAERNEPVLLHGDLHPGNVLDGGQVRGLVAIDPRPSVGDAAADVPDWVFWRAADAGLWQQRNRELAVALGLDRRRLWAWCTAFAAMLAAVEVRRGDQGRVEALLAIAP